ncbi:NADPH:quinone oxidoreductase family protein [Streptomyces sp. NBS 14/10]|uniref:NADPH:quinone oxidoreductase family protein n=1 Tax=Streptomyces sp. NBS 14/10 TaxID=1945643 RepID=UPI000B7FB1AD|nr:NADPH:quinone oxidoreductase family protein [Streptomyces sp. NBS 14/10]KAK1184521.1 NADPH:quinone oxidoreductase family protein [Streptomyces sp. NBS 14/10]
MKRWQASEFGMPHAVLKMAEVAQPEPGPQEARVRVLAASVGLPDLMMVQGRYPLVPTPPVSPGQEIVGIVDKPGPGYPFPAGTRVMGNSRFDAGAGGLAEYALSPSVGAIPALPELTDSQAAGFPGSFHIAHIGLFHRAAIKPGETLLVLGGSGRTGSAAIQLGKALGATVIATARSQDKARFCRLQGADHVINLSEQPLADTVRDLTNGRGSDVIYDTVGGETYDQATQVVSRGGRVLLVGFSSGKLGQPNPQSLLFDDYSVSGALSVFRSDTERDETLSTLSDFLRRGSITPPVTDHYTFDAVPTAIASRSGGAVGQAVVTLSSTAGLEAAS